MTSLGLRRGHARAFQFAPNGVRSDFRLLEVNDELLAEICKDGYVAARSDCFVTSSCRCMKLLEQLEEAPHKCPALNSVVIKGGEEEEAVLCTSKKTFAMKLVETTNLQLLVRPTQQDEQVCKLGQGWGASRTSTAPQPSRVYTLHEGTHSSAVWHTHALTQSLPLQEKPSATPPGEALGMARLLQGGLVFCHPSHVRFTAIYGGMDRGQGGWLTPRLPASRTPRRAAARDESGPPDSVE